MIPDLELELEFEVVLTTVSHCLRSYRPFLVGIIRQNIFIVVILYRSCLHEKIEERMKIEQHKYFNLPHRSRGCGTP